MLTYNPPPHMDAKALIERARQQLLAWHAKYGEHQPTWLPPASDVRWLEDAIDYLAAHALPEPTAPLNGIAANSFHGEGAIAQCGYCRRYSLDPRTLGEDRRQPVCRCGSTHGWSGSFERPGPDAQWSGGAPTGAKEVS